MKFSHSGEKGLVSVIIPVFRRPDYLNQALASVLAQTWQDLEILVVDDASGDEFVRQYRLPPSGRLLRLDVNGGPSAARNAGMAEARGEFIAFLDSDDAWLPDKLSRQVGHLATHPEAALTYCHFQEVDPDMKPLGTHPRVKPPHPEAFKACLRSPIIKTPSTVLARREAFEKAGGFDPALRYAEDRDLWLRIALDHPFHCDPEPGVLYRVHADQLTSPQHRLKNARAEAQFMYTWALRLESAAQDRRRVAGHALSSAYRGLAKALFECEGNRTEAFAALRKAWRANPLDHRVPFKMLALCLDRRSREAPGGI